VGLKTHVVCVHMEEWGKDIYWPCKPVQNKTTCKLQG